MGTPPTNGQSERKAMGKAKTDRRLDESEAQAVGRNIRISPQKLNVVAQAIRGLDAGDALAELTFSRRRIAGEVKKILQSAIANAENNHQLDVDRLYVAEATVGKDFVMKRMRARARGRMGRIKKPFSNITIVLREQDEDEESETA
jgi:large subunit ribosomal protein L22